MLDYLIVGSGLAGISFSEILEQNNKTFKVISDNSQTSSLVAGGLINPVILKRFTLAWRAKEQLVLAKPFYESLERKLDVKVYHSLPVVRRFASVKEQNMWFEASDKIDLKVFLSDDIHQNKNRDIDAPLGFGKVKQTARVDTKQLVQVYVEYLLEKEMFLEESFDYTAFRIKENHVRYKSIQARKVVFAEGFGMKENPYFNYLPLNGNKGEYVFVRAPGLKESKAIKTSIFCIPEGGDIYRIGANYDRTDTTNTPTEKTKAELLNIWQRTFKCQYKVVGHVAGVRPTVGDRRPLVGQHTKFRNLYVLNGLGSRGVLIAPYAANKLFRHIEFDETIPVEMNISRFTDR